MTEQRDFDQRVFPAVVDKATRSALYTHKSHDLHARQKQFVRSTVSNGPFTNYAQYAQGLASARQLRFESHKLKDAALRHFPKSAKQQIGHFGEIKSVTHSILERQRARGFKKMIGDPDKARSTKYTLRDAATGIADDYRRVADLVKNADPETRRAVVLKSARYVDSEIDRQHNAVSLTSASWLGKRAKPGGDKSLHRALEDADDSKKKTHGIIQGALYETAGMDSSEKQ